MTVPCASGDSNRNIGVARLGPIKNRYQKRHFQVLMTCSEWLDTVQKRGMNPVLDPPKCNRSD